MNARAVLLVALVAVGVLCAALVVVTVVARVVRRQRNRHLERLTAPHRMLLLTVAAGEDDDEAAAAGLAALGGEEWEAVRPAVLSLLGKIRGGPAESLAEVLRGHGEIDRARRATRSRSSFRRATAAHLLGTVRDSASVAALVGLLDDADEDVRVAAARSLGRIGDPAAAAPLLRAAGRRDGSGLPGIPAWIAAEALLALGSDAAPVVEVGIADEDPVVRSVAVAVATHGALPGAVDLVRAHLGGERDPDVLGAMTDCLGRVGRESDAVLLIGLTAAGTPPDLRRRAVRALGGIGGPTAGACLVGLLDDPDRATAAVAADALVDLGAEGTRLLLEARAARPTTGRIVSSALHLATLRGTLREAS